MEWLRDNWLRVHLAISPLGTLGVTWLLISAVGDEQWWNSRESLELAGQAVPFGGIIYGSSILVLEVTVRMLWALAQRQKDMDRAREQGREEGREQGQEEGREQVLKAIVERGVKLPPEILEEFRKTE